MQWRRTTGSVDSHVHVHHSLPHRSHREFPMIGGYDTSSPTSGFQRLRGLSPWSSRIRFIICDQDQDQPRGSARLNNSKPSLTHRPPALGPFHPDAPTAINVGVHRTDVNRRVLTCFITHVRGQRGFPLRLQGRSWREGRTRPGSKHGRGQSRVTGLCPSSSVF